MKNENETRAVEVSVGDYVRPYAVESRSGLFRYIMIGLVTLSAGASIYFYPQLRNAWIIYGPQRQAANPQSAELASTLGVSNVPAAILGGPDLDVNFDRLRRENCDRTALLSFATKLAEVGYPRDAANALTTFASRCGNGDDALWAAVNVLMNISDFNGVIKITSSLVGSIPTSPDVRYARGQAFQAAGKFEQAISDYVSTIELIPNTKNVSSKVFTDLAASYVIFPRKNGQG